MKKEHIMDYIYLTREGNTETFFSLYGKENVLELQKFGYITGNPFKAGEWIITKDGSKMAYLRNLDRFYEISFVEKTQEFFNSILLSNHPFLKLKAYLKTLLAEIPMVYGQHSN